MMMNSRGWSGGRGGGRGFKTRGRGFSGSTKSGDTRTTDKPKEFKFTLHSERSTHASSYTSVKEHIELYIKRTFPEGAQLISKAIHDLEEPDFDSMRPNLMQSTLSDASLAANENKIFEIILVNEIRIWNDDRKDYGKARNRAYRLILENHVDTALKARIEAQSDFASRIQDNPIELMRTIRDLCHETDDTKYGVMELADTLGFALNMR